MKDFIELSDFTGGQLRGLIDRAIGEKAQYRQGTLVPTLARKTLAMVFEKPSLRTRVSFEAAMTHLGGHALHLSQTDIGLGSREAVQDIARVLGRMCDGVMARTFSHDVVRQLALHCPVPVINALTDYCHPCQAVADMMTMLEHFGELAGRTVAFVGDGNNVARSLATACSKLQMKFVLASPKDYRLEDSFVDSLPEETYRWTDQPRQAVADADVVYTDTWVSMGQEDQKQARLRAFGPFQVNAALLAAAPDEAIVMHCLPAYRGLEITDEVFEAHADTIMEQAENRLHFQRTLLNVLIGEGGVPDD
ncbi:MAG: ornithine carbamoyltransferase [Planctomycetes bacterium]|nr:ornithine carbamoyltransferase [Planctomycetota bacterium]